MKYRTRIYYTKEQQALMWDRRKKGESLRSIATCPDVIGMQGDLARCGGRRTDRVLAQLRDPGPTGVT